MANRTVETTIESSPVTATAVPATHQPAPQHVIPGLGRGVEGDTAVLQRMTNGRLSQAGNALIQLQRSRGNRHVQRIVAQSQNQTGLPDNLKAGIEGLSGLSLDDVQVHYNSSKPAQLQALAYTQGTEIHVGPGQEKHLPHEAWHVVQQMQGRVRPPIQMIGTTVLEDPRLEREADIRGRESITHQNTQPYPAPNEYAHPPYTNKGIIQLMSVADGQTVVSTVKNLVPKAANRLWDWITTLGASVDRSKLCDDVLNYSGIPFGTNNLNDIVPRAGIAGITRGAVCDNYQEMVIAEIARSGLYAATDTVHAESYPGHSYVTVSDTSAGAVDHSNDLIVDAWRNEVDLRSNFNFFAKYQTSYTQYPQTPMAPGTNWQNDAMAQTHVGNFLTNHGHTVGNLQQRMDAYMAANPGHRPLASIYPI